MKALKLGSSASPLRSLSLQQGQRARMQGELDLDRMPSTSSNC